MEIGFGINDVELVAGQLITNSKTKTLLFYGNMGVGKTTLIKTIIKLLGSMDVVNSPTFSIVNEYKLENDKIFHFDLYRIKDVDELYNFGIEDYLDSDSWIFIEWPEIVESFLNNDYDKIEIKLDEKNNRVIKF